MKLLARGITSETSRSSEKSRVLCFADRIPEEILKKTLFRLADTPETTSSKDVLFREALRQLERFDLLNDKTEIFGYLEKKGHYQRRGNYN